ncbi:polysaccharide biosynthesis C-terminal domain-containing protein [Aeromonas veronii]
MFDTLNHYYLWVFILSRGIFNFSQITSLYYQAKSAPHIFSNYSIYSKVVLLISMVCIEIVFGLNSHNIYLPFLFESLMLLFSFSGIKFRRSSFEDFVNYTPRLLKASIPLILSSIMVQINVRSDILILEKIGTKFDLELYSAIARIILPAFFFPRVIGTLAYPHMIDTYNCNDDRYKEFLMDILSFSSFVSILLLSISIFLGPFFIDLLFSSNQDAMYSLFITLSVSWIFIMKGPILGRALIIQNCSNHEAFKTVAGAFINVGLNVYLIPLFGAGGAAIATIISYAFSEFFYYSLFPSTRLLFKVTLYSVIPRPNRVIAGFKVITRS